jgi:hypothetical protein
MAVFLDACYGFPDARDMAGIRSRTARVGARLSVEGVRNDIPAKRTDN